MSGRLAIRAPAALRSHSWRSLVPDLGGDEYRALVEAIRERGIQEPLVITPEGVVLDGRQRLRAATELQLKRVPVRIVDEADPLRYVADSILKRRHLNAGQLAAVAIEYDAYAQAASEAQARKLANLRRGPKSPDVAELPVRGRTRKLIADLAGVSERTVQNVLTVRAHDPATYERLRRDEIAADAAARRVLRALRDRGLPAPPPLPAGPFAVIYADPPWQLGNPDGPYAPENHYPTMQLEQIIELNPPSTNQAVLYLWIVNGLFDEGLQVMNAWGFQAKGNYVWDKGSIGLGAWTRNQHELLLIGSKGHHPPPEPEDRNASVIRAKRGRHSQKPALFYEIIEKAHPHASKLELFARGKPRPGWTAWGNQTEPADEEEAA